MPIDFKDSEYNTALSSHEWQRTREIVFAEQGNKCQFCGRTFNLQLHHIDYTANPEYACLCKECHAIVSQMIIDYNNLGVERVDYQFNKNFIVERIKEIYITRYCPIRNKSVNFLNPDHLERVIAILVGTLRAQYKASDKIIKFAIGERLNNIPVRKEAQKAIADYRKLFIFEAINKGISKYVIAEHLGMKLNKLYSILRGGGS